MSKKEKIALKSVLKEDEDIYFEGKPNKIAFVLNAITPYIKDFVLGIIFNIILLPILFFNTKEQVFPLIVNIILVLLWIVYIIPLFKMLMIPIIKLKEWKNSYYIVTDKSIYIQFGLDQIYYRSYPNDRIGTKVFYRKNDIDLMFGVGTLGFSVDDYYEERICSIKNYEDLYTVLKNITNAKKEEKLKEYEAREERKRELEEQAKILEQEEMFMREKEEIDEKRRHRREEEEFEREMEREKEEYLRRHEEHERMRRRGFNPDRSEALMRREEEERARKIQLEEDIKNNVEDDEPIRKNKENSNINDDSLLGSAEITERPPDKKTIDNYRSRYSNSGGRRNPGKKVDKKSIKFDGNEPASKPVENKFDMSRLWNPNQEEDNSDE